MILPALFKCRFFKLCIPSFGMTLHTVTVITLELVESMYVHRFAFFRLGRTMVRLSLPLATRPVNYLMQH